MATKIQLETRIRELERRLENDEQDMVEVCDRIEKLEQKNNDICGVIYDMTWPHNRAKIRERIHYARIDTGDTEAQDDETPVSNDGSDVRVDADCNADSTGDVSGVDVDVIMGEILETCEDNAIGLSGLATIEDTVRPHIEKLVGEIERLRAEVEELKGISCALWKIIDDIDTYSDATKGNYDAFYKLAMKRQADKSKTGIVSDGYGLFLKGKRIDCEENRG